MKKISVLIPYQPDEGRKDFLWGFVKMRYQRLMPQVELCIGNDDSNLFSRARAINTASKKATTDIFLLADADLVFDPGLIERILVAIHLYPWIIPFSNAYRLSRVITDRLIEEGLPEEIRVDKGDIEFDKVINGAYLNAMPRSAFEAVGGMDERFSGYGFEDMALALSLDTICGTHYRMAETIYHLWHPWARFYHKNYLGNLHLYQDYEAAKGDIFKMKTLINGR
jgi:glycosyltransferase involved in cell wall biosynthesis